MTIEERIEKLEEILADIKERKPVKLKKWFHHCPICSQFIKTADELQTTKKKTGDVQKWHRNCLKKALEE